MFPLERQSSSQRLTVWGEGTANGPGALDRVKGGVQGFLLMPNSRDDQGK